MNLHKYSHPRILSLLHSLVSTSQTSFQKHTLLIRERKAQKMEEHRRGAYLRKEKLRKEKLRPKPEPVPGTVRNVVIFGGAGAGKSSVINLISGRVRAKVGSGTGGCTLQSTPYMENIDGVQIRIHDTAGLNEAEEGTVAARDAIIALFRLLEGLAEGISLLVLCRRGRITDNETRNYKMFVEGLCQKKVPTVILMTGLELEEPNMESWWSRNGQEFHKYGMTFAGHACITSTRGKAKGGRYWYDEEYAESRELTRRLICHHLREGGTWRVEKTGVVMSFMKTSYNWFAAAFGLRSYVLCQILWDALRLGGFSEEDATKISNEAARQGGSTQTRGDGEEGSTSGS